MGISKIGSLFASNVDNLTRQQSAPKKDQSSQAATPSQQAQAASTDAVVFSRTASAASAANVKPAPSGDSSRSARVKELKSQVDSGTYKPDAEKVATAVLKELA